MTNTFKNLNTFPTFFNELFADSHYVGNTNTTPAANILESENDFQIQLAAPGFEKENFKIEVHQKALKVSVETPENDTESQEKVIRKEFSYSAFSRTFRLPATVDTETIEATYSNGILTLLVPKKEEAKPKEPTLLAVK
jgi:HSP20 family protein